MSQLICFRVMHKSESNLAAGACEYRCACKRTTFSVNHTFKWYTYIIRIFLFKCLKFALGYILQLVLLSAHFEDGLWGEDKLCYTESLESTHKHTPDGKTCSFSLD